MNDRLSSMRGVDSIWLTTISDLFVNLSAGWFGVVLILSPTVRVPKKANLLVLTFDIIFGSFSLTVAYMLRTLV